LRPARALQEVLRRRGELHVARRDAAGAVRSQTQRHLVVANVDVGVVTQILGHLGEVLHKLHRVDEIGKAERLREGLAVVGPAVQIPKGGLDLAMVERLHRCLPRRVAWPAPPALPAVFPATA